MAFSPHADTLVAKAQSLTDLVAAAREADPVLAAALTAKPLALSKTPWGTLAAGLVAWGAARWGLDLDPTLTDLVAGVGVLAGSYLMRLVTSGPISSVLPPKAP